MWCNWVNKSQRHSVTPYHSLSIPEKSHGLWRQREGVLYSLITSCPMDWRRIYKQESATYTRCILLLMCSTHALFQNTRGHTKCDDTSRAGLGRQVTIWADTITCLYTCHSWWEKTQLCTGSYQSYHSTRCSLL